MFPLSAIVRGPLVSEADTICLRCLSRFSRPQPQCGRPITTSARRNQNVALAARGRRLTSEKEYFWANGVLKELLGSSKGGRWSPFTRKQSTAILNESSTSLRDTASLNARQELQSSKPIIQEVYKEEEEVLPHRRRRRKQNDESTAEPALPLDASNRLTTISASLPVNSLRRRLTTYLSLSKPRLSFLIVLTTTAAYSVYPVPALLQASTTTTPSLSTLTLLFLTTGTFLTCASANALNMLLEPQHDAKMSRTRNRPLVRKLITTRGALLFAIITGVTGTVALYAGVNPTTAFLAATNIVLYAGVYTPLKRISVVNTWVGAIVGGIPPLMGWTAAAGQCATGSGDWKELLLGEGSAGGWLLAALLFCWQFPHFNALSWPIREEYKNAGYRMMVWANPARNGRVALRYSVLMFPVCIGLAYTGVVEKAFVPLSCAVSGWVVYEAVKFWKWEGKKGSARGLFWASVWHLPIVLVLAMVLKKDLWARVWKAAAGHPDEEEEWEEYDE